MLTRGKNIVLMLTMCMACLLAAAQDKPDEEAEDSSQVNHKILQDTRVAVREIFVTGNKKTKIHIVKREVSVVEGRSYPMSEILKSLSISRQNLMNTTLFVDVSVDFSNWYNDSIDIVVDVKERWYWFPIPIFKPVDRNWNVWINQYDVSFERVNYGIKFMGRNISGRNDNLNIFVQSGYTQQFAFTYQNPFVGNSLKHGFSVNASLERNREINYITENNEQVFYKSDQNFVKEKMMLGAGYSYRKGSIARHNVQVNLVRERVMDSVVYLNPKFFNGGKTTQVFPEFIYAYRYLGVNYIPYPTKGFRFDLYFLKRGITKPMDMWYLNMKAAKFWPLPHKFYLTAQAEMILKFPFNQPYYNLPMLGYFDSYLRGLEYYVVDGVVGGIGKLTLRKQIADVKLKTGLKSRTYGTIPFRIFLKAYGDGGYAYNKFPQADNTLANKFLYTGGFGVDIATIYDVVIRIEYSFNQLNQRAVYFHMNEF
jgi:outer membrane protein assembly factor BamA